MMSARVKRLSLAAIAVVLLLLLVIWVFPQLSLWLAKRSALATFSEQSQKELGATVLSPQVKIIPPATAEAQVVWQDADGYRFSLPASRYKLIPSGDGKMFAADKLSARCFGAAPCNIIFSKSSPDSESYNTLFGNENPYDVLVDTFNATPAGIQAQPDKRSLSRHLRLLFYKAQLAQVGCDKLWMKFETGKYKGIITGDTSCKAILVTLYLPDTKEFADLAIFPGKGATMDDVWRTLSELQVEKK